MEGIFSEGLVGWKFIPDPNDHERYLVQRLVIGQEPPPARSYKIQMAPSGRTFVRIMGRRIYLDQVLRA